MNATEQALLFTSAQETLVGVVNVPETLAISTGVIVVVGGPQYRAGSHRQFVSLARKLSAAGFIVLRFDYRGMGDSTGPASSFLTAPPEIGAAIDALQNSFPSVKNIVLWGLCDAASAALMYVHKTQDARVSGLCLLNPWVRSEASLARTQVKHYYTQRLMQRSFWTKLFSGKVAWGALKGLAKNVRLSTASVAKFNSDDRPFQLQMATAWTGFQGYILLILSGNDYTAKEFREYTSADTAWSTAFHHPRLERQTLAEADHTFSSAEWKASVENMTLNWLRAAATGSTTHLNPRGTNEISV